MRASPSLRTRLDYPRFGQPDLDVLLIEARYHLVGELKRALRKIGHRIWTVPLLDNPEPSIVVKRLLTALVQHRPDFVLTVNHLGFDEDGSMGEILESLEVPIAVWYVDAPPFVLRGRPFPAPSVSVLFSWEKTFVPLFSSVCETRYLPLATDASLFDAVAEPEVHDTIAFVGDSGRSARAKWEARLNPEDASTVHRLIPVLKARAPEVFTDPTLLTDRPSVDRLAAAAAEETSQRRAALLRSFDPTNLHVYGDDDGWAVLLPHARHLHPGPSYGQELAQIYRKHAIHLNVTSSQMPSAVNQRVFDVPASGGFLVSDDQPDVFELFAEDEMLTWQSHEDAVDKSRYYLRHPVRRQALIDRGRQRVLKDHTYIHRAHSLVEAMRQCFGRGVRPHRTRDGSVEVGSSIISST